MYNQSSRCWGGFDPDTNLSLTNLVKTRCLHSEQNPDQVSLGLVAFSYRSNFFTEKLL